jgi:hypothetical protein
MWHWLLAVNFGLKDRNVLRTTGVSRRTLRKAAHPKSIVGSECLTPPSSHDAEHGYVQLLLQLGHATLAVTTPRTCCGSSPSAGELRQLERNPLSQPGCSSNKHCSGCLAGAVRLSAGPLVVTLGFPPRLRVVHTVLQSVGTPHGTNAFRNRRIRLLRSISPAASRLQRSVWEQDMSNPSRARPVCVQLGDRGHHHRRHRQRIVLLSIARAISHEPRWRWLIADEHHAGLVTSDSRCQRRQRKQKRTAGNTAECGAWRWGLMNDAKQARCRS